MSHPLAASLLALVLGVAAGWAASWNEFRSDDLSLASSAAATAGPGIGPRGGDSERTPQPKVQVEGEVVHKFGTMQRGETRKHVFVFRNVGDAPLTLRKGSVSCICTVSKLETEAVPPQGTAQVTLEWTPKTYNPEFRQTAEIITNDPDRQVITLSITGQVMQAVRPIPEDLTLTRVAISEPKTYQFKVLCYRDEEFRLTKLALQPGKLAEFVALEDQPLTAEELAAEQGAKTGRKIVVTLKPGLPVGPLHETIHIETNLAEVPPIDVPLRGTIVSDIALAPRNDLDLEESVFRWGPVSSATGKSTKLHITVRGKHSANIRLTVGEIDPAGVLQASIGEPTNVNDEVRLFPLTLTVPPGAASVNRLGGVNSPLGRVVIETNHPTAPRLILNVRFAVE